MELIEAVSILEKQVSIPIICKIVGDGEALETAKMKVSSLSLNDKVFFCGSVYDPFKKATYYKESDVYILPTYHEGFPRTLYESMIFGTPVITTFVGGIPALMKDGTNCYRIEPKSVNSIVSVCLNVINDYNAAIRRAQTAQIEISSVLSKDRLTHAQLLNKHLQLYAK